MSASESIALVEAPSGPVTVRVYRDHARGTWGAYAVREDGTSGPVVWAAIGAVAAKRAAWAYWIDSIQVRLPWGGEP